MLNIGLKIRELRKSLGMTSSQLASKIGVAQSFISGIENGSKKCSLENLYKICSVLNISLSEFFSDSSDALSDDLRELLDSAKGLSPEQIKAFTEVFKTIQKG
ncbi:helix-turn-helix transcriptional regulator [Crassaminicella thermophila]|uniref:Helix-turn-helix transcriptional regulator n=1 Tax=Crassaminicella thermophila TaxID=2599308 RepID=A0A5C0SDK4_CRATE|nr:helix-turn-helix transcriptional regulator [Crassaminicella thermophila]QEK12623.1 helix-turn-helix transcriptional regulator [Crassaminicella thermophila]